MLGVRNETSPFTRAMELSYLVGGSANVEVGRGRCCVPAVVGSGFGGV